MDPSRLVYFSGQDVKLGDIVYFPRKGFLSFLLGKKKEGVVILLKEKGIFILTRGLFGDITEHYPELTFGIQLKHRGKDERAYGL